jgi:hypothetical protein
MFNNIDEALKFIGSPDKFKPINNFWALKILLEIAQGLPQKKLLLNLMKEK